MSKRPKSKPLVDSDSDLSNEEVEEKQTKKQKSSSSAVDDARQDDGSFVFSIANKRQVSVRDFRGKVLVDIREFYEDKTTGDMKPGKKGISLSLDQWEKLKENMDNIDAAISKF